MCLSRPSRLPRARYCVCVCVCVSSGPLPLRRGAYVTMCLGRSSHSPHHDAPPLLIHPGPFGSLEGGRRREGGSGELKQHPKPPRAHGARNAPEHHHQTGRRKEGNEREKGGRKDAPATRSKASRAEAGEKEGGEGGGNQRETGKGRQRNRKGAGPGVPSSPLVRPHALLCLLFFFYFLSPASPVRPPLPRVSPCNAEQVKALRVLPFALREEKTFTNVRKEEARVG